MTPEEAFDYPDESERLIAEARAAAQEQARDRTQVVEWLAPSIPSRPGSKRPSTSSSESAGRSPRPSRGQRGEDDHLGGLDA